MLDKIREITEKFCPPRRGFQRVRRRAKLRLNRRRRRFQWTRLARAGRHVTCPLRKPSWSPQNRGHSAKEHGFSGRINKVDRIIPYIPIQIDIPAQKPNRVLADEPLQSGMVIPGPVVVQPRAIIFSARVLEGIGGGYAGRSRLAERLVGVLCSSGNPA